MGYLRGSLSGSPMSKTATKPVRGPAFPADDGPVLIFKLVEATLMRITQTGEDIT